MAFRKIKAGLVNGDVEQFIGETGNLFFDIDTGTIRLSDGSTPGGVAVSGGSGGSYTLPTATTTVKGGVKIDGTTITINNQVISGFSGSYTDLTNKPTIPTNNNQLTNGAGYITSSDLPTAVSELSNDTGFLTTSNFDLDTIDLDTNNKLHATGILPGDDEGFTAIFAGRAAGIAALPNTVIQSQAQVNDYAQNNFQNTYDGNHASTEWVATSPNGDDSNYYIDMGINGASWDGTAANSLYTNAGQRDGWLYVQGGNAGGGNLILGTSLANTYTKIIAGNASAGDTEVARFSSTEVKLEKQLTFSDDTTQTTAWTGTVDWADVTNTPTIITTLGSLDDVLTAGATDGQVLKYNATAGKWQPAADLVGSGGSGIGLTDLSASNNSASGGGSLSYNNTTGVFTFTPPDLSTYVTSSTLSSTLSSYATTSYVTSQGYITSSGNAATATKLATARTINGVSFDGTSGITITANTTSALTIGSGLSGTSFNGSTGVTIAVDNTVALRADTHYIGTTSIALNRTSASQTLTGVSIDGNAATVTNGVYTTGSYSNPAWVTSLAYSKISGAPTVPVNVSQLVNDSGYITSTSSLVNGASSVSLASDGILTFPSNTINTGTNPATLYSNSSSSLQWVATDFLPSGGAISTVTAGDSAVDITLITGIPNVATTSVNWTFNNDGTISFPDGTTQYSAYSGDSSTTEALTIGTGLSGTSFNGSTAVTIALDDNYGDTKNPYASKTAKYFLAAPNAANGAPTFRAIVAADIPTLNQNTTGSAATLTTARNINGVSFNGSADITVTAAAGTLTGTELKSTVVTSSLTSVGTLTGLTVQSGSGINYVARFKGSTGGDQFAIGVSSTAGYGAGNDVLNSAGTAYAPYTLSASTMTFKTGSSVPATAFSINSSGTVTFNNTVTGSISGNAGTVTNGVYTTDTGTVTNTMLAGSIANNKLANSSVTVNGTSISLGSSATVTAAAGTLTGTTLNSSVVSSSLTSVGTLTGVTSNAATAFIAGSAAESGVALQMPREGALRNLTNGANSMYFDVSIGGSTNGQFQFRSSSSFTNVLTMSPTAFNVNPDAVVTARTPSFGRLPWNSAIDTELSIDDYRFRISNQGGIFPQIISNTSGTKNSAWTVVAARSGSAITQTGSTGTLVANNAWTSLYTSGGMDSAGDTYVATLQDKAQGRIYRITFMRSDNGSTTGYNIIAERLL